MRSSAFLALLLLAVPLVAAGETYHYEGDFVPSPIPGFTPVDMYRFHLVAGQSVRVELALADADAFTYVSIAPTASVCDITECPPLRSVVPDCSRGYLSEAPFSPRGHTVVTYVAPADGAHNLWVGAQLADDLHHVLDVSLPAADVEYRGVNAVSPSISACHVLEQIG